MTTDTSTATGSGRPRRFLADIVGRGSDIISMNRALAAAIRKQIDGGSLDPGDLDRALPKAASPSQSTRHSPTKIT